MQARCICIFSTKVEKMFTILLHVWELYKHLATGSFFFFLEISHAFILFIFTNIIGPIQDVVLKV